MRESVFGELFYKILLRLNFADFTLPIFKCFEASFWFLNVHLKNVELSFLGRVTILGNRRVIGAEALIHVHIYSKTQEVKSQARKMIFDILKAELDSGKLLDKVAFEDIIFPCRDIIEREYAELASSLERVVPITSAFSLIKDVVIFIGGGDSSGAAKLQGIAGVSGPYEPVDGKSMIKVIIENNTPVTKYKTIELDVSEFSSLRDLKKQVLDLFVCFTSSDVFMMSKGRILYELDKSLKELAISNGQKILLFQNEDYERDTEGDMTKAKEAKIDQVREIIPDFPRDLVSLALTRNGDDVPLTIAYLSEGSGVLLEEELKIIEKRKADIGKTGSSGAGHGQKKAEVKAFLNALAQFSDFYDLIFKFMRLNNDNLSKILWVLLMSMPLCAQTKKQITDQMERNGMGMDIELESHGSPFDISLVLSNPLASQSCYKLYVLSKILVENFSPSILEWLLFEGNLLMLSTSLEVTEVKSLEDKTPLKPQERSAVLRYLGTIMNIMRFLNSKFANPPSLKTKLLTGQPIYAQLLKECEAEDSSPFQGDKDDYFEMYAQTISESGFDSKVYRLLNGFLSESRSLDSDELNLTVNMFQFCLEFGNEEKVSEILRMLSERICSGIQTGESQVTLINIALYYGCLFDAELPLIESLMANIPMVDRFEGLGSLIEATDPLKARIELIGQFTCLMERKKNRNKGTWPSLATVLKKYLKQIKALFECLVKRGQLSSSMWESYGSGNALGQTDPQVEYFNKMKLLSNEIYLLFSQICKFLSQVLPNISKDEDMQEFYREFAVKNLLEVLNDQHSYLSTLSLQSDSRIRTNLYDIILLFASADIANSIVLLKRLSHLYREEDFKANHWNYVDVRRPGSYIGIKNLGSTCYANSLFQQMYHNKRIREFLLGLPAPEQGVLHEMKKVFEQLNAGMLSQADLLGFTKVFTGFEGMPINVKVQQDVNEFFNLLLDIIESEMNQIKYSGVDVFREELGGMFHNEIESLEKDHPYITKNEEHYNTLSLDVKGTGSIQEAFDKYFKTEVFDGDNKLYCEKYNTKIRVMKKTWLSRHMPQTLLVMLKRFEYDGVTYTRYKLNDYFEFPLELNLGKWVNLPSEDGLSLIDEPNRFTYRLKGVIVHSGTSEFGHYYSFIRIGEKWIEFNDTKVSEFSPTSENLKKEWFGADSDGGMFPFTSTSKSAYMLFYEKIGVGASSDRSRIGSTIVEERGATRDSVTGDDGATGTAALVSQELAKMNDEFLKVKAYSDPSMQRFMNELLSRLDSEQGLNRLFDLLVDRKTCAESAVPDLQDFEAGINQPSVTANLHDAKEITIENKDTNVQEDSKEANQDCRMQGQEQDIQKTDTAAEDGGSKPAEQGKPEDGQTKDMSFEIKSDGPFLENDELPLAVVLRDVHDDSIKPGEGQRLYAFLKNLKVHYF